MSAGAQSSGKIQVIKLMYYETYTQQIDYVKNINKVDNSTANKKQTQEVNRVKKLWLYNE